jgi:hypothetical protein
MQDVRPLPVVHNNRKTVMRIQIGRIGALFKHASIPLTQILFNLDKTFSWLLPVWPPRTFELMN